MGIPDNSLVVGVPGKIRRQISDEEAKEITKNALIYVEEAKEAYCATNHITQIQ